jgi:hypothetical protein
MHLKEEIQIIRNKKRGSTSLLDRQMQIKTLVRNQFIVTRNDKKNENSEW